MLYKDAGSPYGPDGFYYAETEVHKSFFSAFLRTIGIGIFVMVALFRMGRFFLKKVIPSPGTGPSKEERDKSWFRVRFLCETVEGNKLLGTVSGGDPGYSETAKMVSNAAICLVDKDNLCAPGGVLTPARSMGMPLVNRLRDADMVLKVEPFES